MDNGVSQVPFFHVPFALLGYFGLKGHEVGTTSYSKILDV